MVINTVEKKKAEKGVGNFWRSIAFLSRMVKGCFPEKVTFEQRAEGDERVSKTTHIHYFTFKIVIHMDYVKSLTHTLSAYMDVKGKNSLGKSAAYAKILRLESIWHVQGRE